MDNSGPHHSSPYGGRFAGRRGTGTAAAESLGRGAGAVAPPSLVSLQASYHGDGSGLGQHRDPGNRGRQPEQRKRGRHPERDHMFPGHVSSTPHTPYAVAGEKTPYVRDQRPEGPKRGDRGGEFA
ncbi:hypothetical protein Abr02nite_25110 [Paractinoplanes brasiliensis]|nr:hypothetical protein Abr02nite_25110 [Actinoplanes brasiliensis]